MGKPIAKYDSIIKTIEAELEMGIAHINAICDFNFIYSSQSGISLLSILII